MPGPCSPTCAGRDGALALFAAARRADVPSVLDADVAEPAILDALVREADHVVFSSHGLARWAGIAPHAGTADHRKAHERAWRAMREANPRARACAVTAGAEGSWWIVDGAESHVPAPRVVAVDTLAAGDVFHGAYALALAEGRGDPRRRALRVLRGGDQVHARGRSRRCADARGGRRAARGRLKRGQRSDLTPRP